MHQEWQSVLAFFQLRSRGPECRMLNTLETWKGASMARVRPLEREDLPAEHRHIYDDIAGSRGGVQPILRSCRLSPRRSERAAACLCQGDWALGYQDGFSRVPKASAANRLLFPSSVL